VLGLKIIVDFQSFSISVPVSPAIWTIITVPTSIISSSKSDSLICQTLIIQSLSKFVNHFSESIFQILITFGTQVLKIEVYTITYFLEESNNLSNKVVNLVFLDTELKIRVSTDSPNPFPVVIVLLLDHGMSLNCLIVVWVMPVCWPLHASTNAVQGFNVMNAISIPVNGMWCIWVWLTV